MTAVMDAQLSAALRAGERTDAAREAEQIRVARDGAPVKWATCFCDDQAHGYPDRVGFVRTEEDALEDLSQTEPNRGHVVVRLTFEVNELHDRLVRAFAAMEGAPLMKPTLMDAVYGHQADALLLHLGGAR